MSNVNVTIHSLFTGLTFYWKHSLQSSQNAEHGKQTRQIMDPEQNVLKISFRKFCNVCELRIMSVDRAMSPADVRAWSSFNLLPANFNKFHYEQWQLFIFLKALIGLYIFSKKARDSGSMRMPNGISIGGLTVYKQIVQHWHKGKEIH